MIIETKHAEVTSNIPEGTGKRRQMKISEAGMAHIVGVLTKLYKDNELAVIRENFTNGVDAHVRAGVKDIPVQITLPTWDKPNYVVTDFGVGMSEDDLLDVYSQYGESSKLGTNEEAGGFGIGAKTGLAIASQFTVVSVKDGMKSVALITKASGLPEINVLSSTPTEEGHGTVVSIPVKDVYAFNAKAREFFQYVDPKSVLVDGKTPKYALDEAEVITNPNYPDFKAYAKINFGWGNSGASYLIMGNVPYLIPEDDVKTALGFKGNNYSNNDITRQILNTTKYFMVPIGSVDLTPNRESLMYTEKTNALIKDYMGKFAESIKISAQEKADAAKDFYEYFKTKRMWKNSFGWDLTYKGKTWETELKLSKDMRRIQRSTDGSGSHSFRNHVVFDEYDHQFFVTGLKAEEYTRINGYISPFLRGRDLTDGVLIITESTEHLTDERTLNSPKITVISYEDLLEEGKKQRKIDRANAGPKTESQKLEYPVLVVADREIKWLPYNEIEEGTPFIHSSSADQYVARITAEIYEQNNQYTRANTSVTRVAQAIETLTDYTHLVLVGGSRTAAAFQKRCPKSPDFSEIVNDKLVPTYEGLFTDEVKEVVAYQNSNWSAVFKKIGADLTKEVADDTIVSLATPADHVKDAIIKIKSTYNHLVNIKSYYDLSKIEEISDSALIDDLDQKYPLVSALDRWQRAEIPSDHIVAYINSVQTINA
ncbi:hypothetical protein SEA_ATUIN_154 [Arthrobacter phage Atuin]|nr:hypothetical protein SEA_ATUIN_253 [Arthrobacter phage Atuin]